jgi:hypothetical protein
MLYKVMRAALLVLLSSFLLRADTGTVQIARMQEAQVRKAQEDCKSMRRNAAWRSGIALALQLGFTAAELYALFSPARGQTAGTTVVPQKVGWGTSIKNFFSDLGIITVKSLFLAIVYQQAEPILAKMRERVTLATDSSWFLGSYRSQAVIVSQELFAFVQLLQALDGALFSLSQMTCSEQQEVQRFTTVGNYVVSLVEKLLGHIRCMAQAMESTDTVGALLASGVVTRLVKTTDTFCEQLETAAMHPTTTLTVSLVCEKFSKAYQSEIILLSSVSAYRAE